MHRRTLVYSKAKLCAWYRASPQSGGESGEGRGREGREKRGGEEGGGERGGGGGGGGGGGVEIVLT